MELLRALGAYCEQPGAAHGPLAAALGLPVPTAAQWHATFVERFYPYASAYLSENGFLGGEIRDAAAGVFRALEAEPPAEADHLAVLLAGYATVDSHGWALARSTLLWEHLLPWVVPYLDRVSQDGPECYRQWAGLLWHTLVELAAVVPRPADRIPVFATAPPGLVHPRTDTTETFIASLLAPVRLGTILTRDDLLAAARQLDLPARMGERRYVLRGLLSQDPAAVLGWLGSHCADSGDRARSWPAPFAVVSRFWDGRADAATQMLTELAHAAAELAEPAAVD